MRWKKWPPFWREKQQRVWRQTLWESVPPTWQSKLVPQQALIAVSPCVSPCVCHNVCHRVCHHVSGHVIFILKDVDNGQELIQVDPSILLHRWWCWTVGPLCLLYPADSRALRVLCRQRAGWRDNCYGTAMDLEDGSRSCFRGRLQGPKLSNGVCRCNFWQFRNVP